MIFCIPCLALLLYFGIASIFVPRYRGYIKDGWRCFLDKIKGKKCSASFDNRMRLAFSTWLAKHGMPRAGKFFSKKKNFDITMTVFAVIFTIVSIYLFYLLVNFLQESPCSVEDACAIGS